MQVNRISRLIKTAQDKQMELNALLQDIEDLIAPHLEYDEDDYHVDIFADEANKVMVVIDNREYNALRFGLTDEMLEHIKKHGRVIPSHGC